MRASNGLIPIVMVLCTAASGFGQPAPESPDLVIMNARLIDGTGAVFDRVAITIRGKRILSVSQGMAAPGAIYEGRIEDWGSDNLMYGMPWEMAMDYRSIHSLPALIPERIIIDAGGKTVMPGLIDTHVHLLDSPDITDETTLNRYLKWGIPETLEAYLVHGVTTIKSMGDPEDAVLRIRERIERGELTGPRLYVVGPVLTIPGGGYNAAALFRLREWPRTPTTLELASVEEACRAVRRLADKGVDALHLDLCSACPVASSMLMTPLSQEILQAVIDEAHRYALPVTASTVEEAAALFAISMGIDGVEHGVTRAWLKDGVLQRRLGIQNISYAPALGVYAYLLPEALSTVMDNLEYLSDGGEVRVVLGTDTFGQAPPGLRTIQEMELMVQAGMAPARVIRAATRDAAEHLGKLHELGTVQPGKVADLIMVDGDPLQTVSVLRDIKLVVREGRIVVDRRYEMIREDVR